MGIDEKVKDKNVFIVEDDEVYSYILTQYFEKKGYNVTTFDCYDDMALNFPQNNGKSHGLYLFDKQTPGLLEASDEIMRYQRSNIIMPHEIILMSADLNNWAKSIIACLGLYQKDGTMQRLDGLVQIYEHTLK